MNRARSLANDKPTLYGPRLPQGNGILQQLKDLAALGRIGKVEKIQRNILVAALSLNALTGDTRRDLQSHMATGLVNEQETIADIILRAEYVSNLLTPVFNSY